MKRLLILFLLFLSYSGYTQEYYITKDKDTIECKILFHDRYPGGITILSQTGNEQELLSAGEIKAYYSEGILMVSKKVLNATDYQRDYIFLPDKEVNKNPISKEVKEAGSIMFAAYTNSVFSKSKTTKLYKIVRITPRWYDVDYLLENDNIGLKYINPAFGMQEKLDDNETIEKEGDVIAVLMAYCKDRTDIIALLSDKDKLRESGASIGTILSSYFQKDLSTFLER